MSYFGKDSRLISDDKLRVPAIHRGKNYVFQPDFDDFVQFMMSGPCHVLVITKKEATDPIPHWKELRKSSENGPDEPEKPDR